MKTLQFTGSYDSKLANNFYLTISKIILDYT